MFAKYTVTVFTLGVTKLGGCCTVYTATKLACVASVSVGFPHKFRCFGRAKIRARPKKKEGEGERRTGNACSQTPGI